MGYFPFERQEQPLCSQDFLHFQNLFSSTILQLIPFAHGPVTFIDPAYDHGDYNALKKPKNWLRYGRQVLKRQRAVLAGEKPVLFLPVWGPETIIGIAAIEGVEEQFTDTLSEEWLSDRSRIISREFFLLKQLAYEPATELFNGRHLQDMLEKALSGMKNEYAAENTKQTGNGSFPQAKTSLLLLEIHPRANSAEKALNYIIRAGYYLESFIGQRVLHHLGNGIFGLIGQNMDGEQARKLGKNILGWFRREGFSRVHIGINTVGGTKKTKNNEQILLPAPLTVLDQTWSALRKACRRGPFALCTYSSINNPDKHPLRRTRPAVMSKLKKIWTDCDKFAFLLISQDKELPEKVFPRRILALLEHQMETVTINKSEIFVFIADADPAKALTWTRKFKKKLPEDLGATYSIGIAYFPCIDFSKSDIPQNARKALLHSSFYGPNTVTVFDGISLNVSGDIYYSEGDIVRAVREYRKGLVLDPNNTNLQNSLGEAYAQMNQTKKARPFFEAIIRADSNHYMALFNLGVTYLTSGEYEQAIEYFEKALTASRFTADINHTDDLILQLGKLYCLTGRYKKAVRLLEKEGINKKRERRTPVRKALLRYLGEAYMETGRIKEAIIILQNAIHYNPHDAYALSMLGELYARENQGDDIALSLCMQAIAIDDRQWQHWFRLARVRYKMSMYESALEALMECLHREKKNIDALYLAGKIYAKLDTKKKAAAMFKSVLRIDPNHKTAAAALKKIMIN